MNHRNLLFCIKASLAFLFFHTNAFAEPGRVTLPTPVNGNRPVQKSVAPTSTTAPGIPGARPAPTVTENQTPTVVTDVDISHLVVLRDLSYHLLRQVRIVQTQVDLIDQSTYYAGLPPGKDEFDIKPFAVSYANESKKIVQGVDPTFKSIYELGGIAQALYNMSQATVGGVRYIFNGGKVPAPWKELKLVAPFSGMSTLIGRLRPTQEKAWGNIERYVQGIETALAATKEIPREAVDANIAVLRTTTISRGYLDTVASLVNAIVIKFGENGNPATQVEYHLISE